MKHITTKTLNEEDITKIKEEFEEYLRTLKSSSGKIEFKRDISENFEDIICPTIFFTGDAWLKMQNLIQLSSDEIGWHGIVERDAENNFYLIKDILVYPQRVTEATVTVEEEEKFAWDMKLSDEKYRSMRMQGHSHVNMTTFPSGTDRELYDKYLSMLKGDDFYLFFIFNKRGEYHLELYDMAKNIVFDQKDCPMYILIDDGKTLLETWYKESVKQVKKEAQKYTPKKYEWDDKRWYER